MGSDLDLELEIAPSGMSGVFRVNVDSPAGAASGELRLDVDALLERRRELAACVLASAVTRARGLTEQERPIRETGQTLFDALFAERIYGRYTASMQEAARRGAPLRVVLRLRAPELASLPWETLFDAEADEYLCQREPVVRYVETAQAVAPLRVDLPLRILGLVSAPRDLPRLDVAEERRRLADALADLGSRSVELVWAQRGSWPELQRLLIAGPWHIVHFIGHGGIDTGDDGGVLWLEEEGTGRATSVSALRFSRLLRACRPVPPLVVLNSCRTGEAAADDLLSSTAAALVHSGTSAVVAMQFAITDVAALAFARGFYQALARAEPVDEAVRLGRIAIDGTGERTLEWVTPVLYLRTAETRLFAVGSPEPTYAAVEEPIGEEAAHEAALHGLYVQALAALRTGRGAEAIALLDSLLTLDPGYRDARERRDAARRTQQLTAGYERARVAEDAHKWAEAEREYRSITDTDPDYRDARDRLHHCQRRQQILSLHDELRLHAEASNWQAVVAVGDELGGLDPDEADVDGLVTTARRQLDVVQREAEEQARREAEEQARREREEQARREREEQARREREEQARREREEQARREREEQARHQREEQARWTPERQLEQIRRQAWITLANASAAHTRQAVASAALTILEFEGLVEQRGRRWYPVKRFGATARTRMRSESEVASTLLQAALNAVRSEGGATLSQVATALGPLCALGTIPASSSAGVGQPRQTSAAALKLVRNRPGITVYEIAQALGCTQGDAHTALVALSDGRMVERRGPGWYPQVP